MLSIDEGFFDLFGIIWVNDGVLVCFLFCLVCEIEDEIGIMILIGLLENKFFVKIVSEFDKF